MLCNILYIPRTTFVGEAAPASEEEIVFVHEGRIPRMHVIFE